MKPILILILWILLTLYLLIERMAKALITIVILLWDFRIRRERYKFWKTISLLHFEFKTMKDYYQFKPIPFAEILNEWNNNVNSK